MSYQPDTLAIHAGQSPDPATNARAVPIYATTSYVFNNTEHAANLFGLREFGNIYTRIMNPTSDVFEKRIAELEGGVAALAVASGQAAETLTVLNLARAGDNLVSLADAVRRHLQPLRLHAAQVGHHDQVRGHPQPRTRSGRRSTTAPGSSTSRRSATRGSTCPTSRRWPRSPTRPAFRWWWTTPSAPPRCRRPIQHGADIVVHSATKWIGGHGTAIGGVVVDAGKFDWASPTARRAVPRVHLARPELPRPGLHRGVRPGAPSSSSSGSSCCATWAPPCRRSTPSSSCRGWRRCRSGSGGIPRTRSPWRSGWRKDHGWSGCPTPASRSHPEYRNAAKYLEGGFGGVLTFGVKGGNEAAKALIDRVKLFSLLANVGDAKSLIIHPASTTHEQLTPEQQRATGTTPELIRLSRRPRGRARPHRRPRSGLWVAVPEHGGRGAAAGAKATGDGRFSLAARHTRTSTLGDFVTAGGARSFRDARLRYRVLGDRRAARDTAGSLVFHALTGSAEVGPWWGPLFGPGGPLDPSRPASRRGQPARQLLRLDRARSGPASTMSPFPALSPPTWPAPTSRCSTTSASERVALATGGSLGGHGGARVGPAVAACRSIGWSSSPPRPPPRAQAIAWNTVQRMAIEADPAWRRGRYPPGHGPTAGLAAARALAMITYRSGVEFDAGSAARPRARAGRFDVDHYLRRQGDKLVARFDAASYVALDARHGPARRGRPARPRRRRRLRG